MEQIVISRDDMLEMSIRTAKDLLIKAYMNPTKEEKLKALILAQGIIKKNLEQEGINLEDIKIKEEK